MRNFDLALQQFREEHGASLYIFIHGPLWPAIRAFLCEYGPNRKLVGMAPQQIAEHGQLFAANIQGFQEVIEMLESTMLRDPQPHESQETYLPDSSGLTGEDSPKPPAPVVPPKPRTKRKK